MSEFSVVAVIFNPNSTGPSKDLAERLVEDLRKAEFDVEVRLTPTEHAGHAVDLAYEIAKNNERPLIVSSSGDGGYNEVVNGAMRAQLEGAAPVCAVLAAGNANDHSRSVVDRPLAEMIVDGNTVQIDLLRSTVKSSAGDESVLFAHSYIGVGLTPTVAVELNKEHLNRFKETFIVFKALRDLQPVEIEVDGTIKRIDSLVIANIDQMAKVLTIAENAQPDDGRMKVTVFPYRKRARLIRMLLRAVVSGVKGRDTDHYEFTARKETAIQYDGEVHGADAGDSVSVTVAKGALTTLG